MFGIYEQWFILSKWKIWGHKVIRGLTNQTKLKFRDKNALCLNVFILIPEINLKTYMNWTLWVEELLSTSIELSQSAADQRQMDQLSVLVVQQHCELWFPGLNRQEGHMKVVRCWQKKVSSMFALMFGLKFRSSQAEVMKTCVYCIFNWPRCKEFTHSHRTQKPHLGRFKWDFWPVEKGYHKAL